MVCAQISDFLRRQTIDPLSVTEDLRGQLLIYLFRRCCENIQTYEPRVRHRQ